MTVVKDTVCWVCGYVHDRASAPLEDEKLAPSDGDISICIICGSLGIFDSKTTGGLREPTKDEYLDIAADAQAQQMLRAWKRTLVHGVMYKAKT